MSFALRRPHSTTCLPGLHAGKFPEFGADQTSDRETASGNISLGTGSSSQGSIAIVPSSVKPAAIPSLDTVLSGHNAGKSQGQLDHNARITNPQEWPHLHVPFGHARKKFKDLTNSELVYGYLDIVNSD